MSKQETPYLFLRIVVVRIVIFVKIVIIGRIVSFVKIVEFGKKNYICWSN